MNWHMGIPGDVPMAESEREIVIVHPVPKRPDTGRGVAEGRTAGIQMWVVLVLRGAVQPSENCLSGVRLEYWLMLGWVELGHLGCFRHCFDLFHRRFVVLARYGVVGGDFEQLLATETVSVIVRAVAEGAAVVLQCGRPLRSQEHTSILVASYVFLRDSPPIGCNVRRNGQRLAFVQGLLRTRGAGTKLPYSLPPQNTCVHSLSLLYQG